MYVCVCVCSKYDGPSVSWDDVPDVPRDGVRRSSDVDTPERRHLQPEPRPTPATACGCRLRYVSVCCAASRLPACLSKVSAPSLNICSCLCVCVCACVCVAVYTVSCALLLFGTGFAIPSYQYGARWCCVCGVSVQRHVISTTPFFVWFFFPRFCKPLKPLASF
jgi:hypothetical protein